MGCRPKKERPGADEIELQRQMQENWNDFKVNTMPMIDDEIAYAQNLSSENSIQQTVNDYSNVAREGAENVVAGAEYSPRSTNFLNAVDQSTQGNLGASVESESAGNQAAQDNYIKALDGVVKVGRGLNNSASNSLSRSANLEQATHASQVANSNNRSNQLLQTAAFGAGYAGDKFLSSRAAANKKAITQSPVISTNLNSNANNPQFLNNNQRLS